MKLLLKKLFQIKREKVYYIRKDDLIELQSKIYCKLLLINEENYDRVLDMRKKDVASFFYKMLKNGQVGLFAEVEGCIVAHAWMQIATSKKNNYNNGFGKLKRNEAIIHFCNTDSQYRGNNIYPLLIYNLAEIYFNKYSDGILYITTSLDNYSSQRGLVKVGFKYLEDRIICKICKYIKFTIPIK